MQIRETGFLHFGAEVVHSLACLLKGAEAFGEKVEVPHAEHRTSVNLDIVRTMKILFYNPIDNHLPLVPINARVESEGLCVLIDVRVPIVRNLVVRVHYIEVHLLV